jgi:hypothetical protein
VDYSDLLERLGPEGLQQLMAMSELESQDADLQQQLAQAEALRYSHGPERIGATAGALQSVADIINAHAGKRAAAQARQDRQGVQGKLTAGRSAMANAYFPAAAQPGYAPPLEDFSNDGIPEYLRRQ